MRMPSQGLDVGSNLPPQRLTLWGSDINLSSEHCKWRMCEDKERLVLMGKRIDEVKQKSFKNMI